MKKQGKHIHYLKTFVEFIVNNISIIGLALFLFLLFLRIDQVSGFGVKLLHKISARFFSKIDPQNYQIIHNTLLKSANAALSVITSILINKFISIIAKKKKYAVKLRREIYYKLRKQYIISDKWITHTIIPKLINVFLHGKPLNYYNQSDHVKQLMNFLRLENNTNHIVWIEGNAYSGKTTIIFRFIEEMANKKNLKLYEEYEKHIYPSFSFSTMNL